MTLQIRAEKVYQPISSDGSVTAVRATSTALTMPGMPSVTASQQLGAIWHAIGESPTTTEMNAVGRYRYVTLNAWEGPKMRTMKAAHPSVKFFVYKCLSSLRNYAGAVDNGVDATYLPTGVGYVEATNTDTAWFALTTTGARIQWGSFPGHWQASVWNTAYQQRWANNVVAEVVAEGWDGVSADNDFASLHFYSAALLAGTSTAAQTDLQIRNGLDALVTVAGTALSAAGKLFIPNVSESRLYPGRWASHSRFGGAMEEHPFYAPQVNNSEYNEMINLSPSLINYIVSNESTSLIGFTQAAIVDNGNTGWEFAPGGDYGSPHLTSDQDIVLGTPLALGVRATNGVWWRDFTLAWVGHNPGGTNQTMTVLGVSRTIPAGGSLIVMK